MSRTSIAQHYNYSFELCVKTDVIQLEPAIMALFFKAVGVHVLLISCNYNTTVNIKRVMWVTSINKLILESKWVVRSWAWCEWQPERVRRGVQPELSEDKGPADSHNFSFLVSLEKKDVLVTIDMRYRNIHSHTFNSILIDIRMLGVFLSSWPIAPILSPFLEW